MPSTVLIIFQVLTPLFYSFILHLEEGVFLNCEIDFSFPEVHFIHYHSEDKIR